MPPVIDFHIHPVYYEPYCPSAQEWIKEGHRENDWQDFVRQYSNPEFFSRFLRASGVDWGIVLAELSPVTTGICTNEYVADFCAGQDNLIPFCNVNPHLVTNAADELERLMKTYAFKGIKLYPTYHHFYPSDSMLYPLYAKALEMDLPVMLHTGSSIFKGARIKYGDPLFLDDVAVDFPGLKILLVHSGRGVWYDHAFLMARLHENVYLEIAGLPPRKLLDYFPELERLEDKIIFGTDWPGVGDIKGNIAAIRNLPVAQSAKDKILGLNALKVLPKDVSRKILLKTSAPAQKD